MDNRIPRAAIFCLLFALGCSNSKGNNSNGRGDNVTKDFLSEYAGRYLDRQNHEEVTLKDNREIIIARARKVGGDSSKALTQIIDCAYSMKGNIDSVVALYETTQANEQLFTPYELNFTVTEFRLLPSSTRDADCQTYEAEQQALLPFSKTLPFETIEEDKLRFHTQTEPGINVTNRKVGDSTMDEIFELE